MRAVSPRAVSALLHAGRENALPLRDLKQLTGLTGREVRLLIQQERLCGVPILSDCQRGYFLPGDEREVQEFVRSMRHRAGEILKVAGALDRNNLIQSFKTTVSPTEKGTAYEQAQKTV